MFEFGERHPILFEIVLIVISFLLAAVFVFAGNILYLPSELSSSIGRIVIGILLFLICRRAFRTEKPFRNLSFLIPALLLAVWNLYYGLSCGKQIGGISYLAEGLITALAPAVFEEVIFRGIFLYNLKKKGYGDLTSMLLSAFVFSLTHLTNIVGMDLSSVVLQVGYSFVVGMVLAALFLKNGSILQVILVHFLIDYVNRIFTEQPSSASTFQLILFAGLLVFEAIYALWLTGRKQEREEI